MLTKKESEELAKALYTLELRKKARPIDFFKPLPYQKAFFESVRKNLLVGGGNRPLAYGTLVRMADGSAKPIEDIKIGDYVLTNTGERATPTKVVDIPFDGEDDLYKITMAGGREVTATLDHCFPAVLRQDYVDKATVREIKDSKYEYKKLIASNIQEYFPSEVPFSGVLLGLYLGDGSSAKSPSNGYHNCNFTNIKPLIRDLFADEVRKVYPKLKCKAYPADETRLYIKGEFKHGNGFLNTLKELELAGHKSATKFIPDVFKKSSVEDRRGVLRGMILTDGCVEPYRVSIYSNSLRQLKDLKEIIISLGGRCKVYTDRGDRNLFQKQQYYLRFPSALLKVMGITGLLHKEKEIPTQKNNRQDLLIKSVELVGKGKCRCITIEHPSHIFVLANGILTYNCGKTKSGAARMVANCRKAQKEGRHWEAWAAGWADMSIPVQQKAIYELLPKDGSVKYAKWSEARGFSNKLITFCPGVTIRFKTYDQGRESFQGTAKDEIWLDEEPPEEIVNECKARLMDRNGTMYRTMTPLNGLTYTYDEFILNESENPEIEYWFWDSTLNPYIDSGARDSILGQYASKEAEVRRLGTFMNLTSGTAYYSFSEDNVWENSFNTPFKYIQTIPLEVSCDFNVDLMSWNISQAIPLNGVVDVIFDCVELEGMANTEKMCIMLKEKYPNNKLWSFSGDISGSKRSPEASKTNWAIIQEHFPTADIFYQNIRNIKDRVDSTNARFKDSRGHIHAYVTKNCKRLIKDLRQVTWEHLQSKTKAGLLTHSSDGLSYLFFKKYPLTGKIVSKQW